MITRVAIVEDDAIVRSSLEDIVNEALEMVCVAAWGSGEEAVKGIGRANADVVLMDIHLPAISGIECTARIKEIRPQLQVLMLTVYEDTDRIFEALKAGASGYLLKRSDPDQIVEAIREVRNGGSPMTSHIARKVVQSFREPAVEPKAEVLSRREQEILDLCGKGFSSKEIAQELSVSLSTIKTHLYHIYGKLHVRSRIEALIAVSGGTLPPRRN